MDCQQALFPSGHVHPCLFLTGLLSGAPQGKTSPPPPAFVGGTCPLPSVGCQVGAPHLPPPQKKSRHSLNNQPWHQPQNVPCWSASPCCGCVCLVSYILHLPGSPVSPPLSSVLTSVLGVYDTLTFCVNKERKDPSCFRSKTEELTRTGTRA